MTQHQVRAILNALGVTFRRTPAGDFRVNLKGAPESHAYYTTDLEDALDTGMHLSAGR